ncbi:MAG: DUF4349 domain-containing protein [Algibacter sp.]
MKSIFYFFIFFIAFACNSIDSDKSSNYEASEIGVMEIDREVQPITENFNVAPSDATQQKIIKESFLRFETKDLDNTYLQIKKTISNNKGFIQNDNSNKSYNTITRHLIIRIPTHAFQNTLDSISKGVEYFDTKRISSKDVTEEFIDIEARLKAKKTLEKRYLELLTKAKNVKEILEIERELSNIREEIEAKQGRLKYLQNKVSLSTIDVEFYKYTSEGPVNTSYGTKMWNSVKSGFNGLSVFFLGILYIWPFIILTIIIVYFVKKRLRKKKK